MAGGLIHCFRGGGDYREFRVTHGTDMAVFTVVRGRRSLPPRLILEDVRGCEDWDATWTADASVCILRHDGQTLRITAGYKFALPGRLPLMQVAFQGARVWEIDCRQRTVTPKDRVR